MRNKHGKGRIHPSPSQQPASGVGDCLSVLSLLPAAILALTAALCLEDKEVLAYFITRCIIGSGSAYEASTAVAGAADQTRKKGKGTAGAPVGIGSIPEPHAPRFDCGCFGCYTSFWIRWGSSPHGELIDQLIEAFEKHLAEGEGAAAGKRNKERRGGPDKQEKKRDNNKSGRKGKKKKGAVTPKQEQEASGVVGVAEKDAQAVVALAAAVVEGTSTSTSSSNKAAVVKSEVAAVLAPVAAEHLDADRPVLEVAEWSGDDEDASSSEEPDGVRSSLTAGGDKKKGWPDVMGFLNSRLWSLWSPSA